MIKMWDAKTVTVSLGNKVFTGKNVRLNSMDVCTNNNLIPIQTLNSRAIKDFIPSGPQLTTITLEFVCTEFISEILSGKIRSKIRNKTVNNCSIEELLFAVRKKITKEWKPKKKSKKG